MIKFIYLILSIIIVWGCSANSGILVREIDNQHEKFIGLKSKLGVVAKDDTISSYYNEEYVSNTLGFWYLEFVDTTNNSITITNTLNTEHINFKISEINYILHRKETNSTYREPLIWVGALGGLWFGAGSIVEDQNYFPITIGIGSIAYLFLTRKWVDTKKYKVVDLK